MIELWQLPLLFATGLAAGFVDSIAGGGGLITLPVLLGFGFSPQQALGTNKLQATFGSGSAAWHYAEAGTVDWRDCTRGFVLTFVGAALGAFWVQQLDAAILKRVIPVLIAAVALYALLKPQMGEHDLHPRMRRAWFDVLFGLGLGCYDGFFGPGTGMFWTMAFVLGMGFNLTRATGYTKVMNFASNIASLVMFLIGGHILFTAGLVMGFGQLLGARLGQPDGSEARREVYPAGVYQRGAGHHGKTALRQLQAVTQRLASAIFLLAQTGCFVEGNRQTPAVRHSVFCAAGMRSKQSNTLLMKFLKKLFIFLFVIAAALAVISQFLPSTFKVERTIIIRAGTDKIYPLVNDVSKWPEWTVWNKDNDPSIVFTYEGPAEGVGAISKWESKKSGPGKFTITESDPAKGVKTELVFGPGGTPMNGWVTFAPAGTDTKVAFGFGGAVDRNPMNRWLYFCMDKFAGPEFEKNLAGLKKKVEAVPPTAP